MAALALAACAPQAQSAGTTVPRPAMWKLADEDTTLYLFGTFHLLPEGQTWRTPAFDAALTGADELVLEVGNVDDPTAAAQAMFNLGVTAGLPPLAERVPEAKREELRALIAESGVPAAALDRMETWAAGLMLLGVMFKRLGLSGDAGVEQAPTRDYRQARKPILGLETAAEQFGFFDTLSEGSQRAFLAGLLDDPEEMRRQFAQMLAAWTAGDVDAIAATFNDDVNLTPELRALLLERRNAKWADWLARRLERPGTVLVAVGAGHLAGPDSVQAMLRKKGLKAKRVQ
jgi:uncharacterized protein YbaP (TraB family)